MLLGPVHIYSLNREKTNKNRFFPDREKKENKKKSENKEICTR